MSTTHKCRKRYGNKINDRFDLPVEILIHERLGFSRVQNSSAGLNRNNALQIVYRAKTCTILRKYKKYSNVKKK
jgi:hypothetical protein